MTELELKYGCNPNQKPARIFMEEGDLPLKVLNGRPGYINFMDALNSWQLVMALKKAARLPRRGGAAPAPQRCRTAHLLCPGGRAVPHRLRLYPGPGGRPAVLLRRLGRPLRCL